MQEESKRHTVAIIKTDQCFFINKSQRSPLEIWKEFLQLANEEGKTKQKPTVGILLDVLVLDHMRRFYVYTLEA